MNKNFFSRSSFFKFSLVFSSFILGEAQCDDSWDHLYYVVADVDEAPSQKSSSQFYGYHAPAQIIFPIESQSGARKQSNYRQQTSIPAQEPVVKPQWHESTIQTQTQTVIEGNPEAPHSYSLKRVSDTPNQQNTPKIQISTSREQTQVAQAAPPRVATDSPEKPDTILINFNNVSIIEYIRFISRLTNKNFVFDDADLQFNVTIVSEEPATFENIMAALLQVLRIHDLALLEQGNNLIIHKNPRVNAVSQVIADDISSTRPTNELVTQVFRLNTSEADKVASVIRPLTSQYALVEVLADTNHLIITDLATNVAQIAKLIKSVDSPNSGLVIGQYVVRTTSIETLIPIALKIMGPIAQEQPLSMVPWSASNSIFVVSTPYLVERTLSILQHIDQNQRATKIFDLKEFKYSEEQLKGLETKELPPGGLFVNNLPYEYPIAPQRTEEGGLLESGWQLDQRGNWILQFKESEAQQFDQTKPPKGAWQIDQQGVWYFKVFPKTATEAEMEEAEEAGPPPKGQWRLDDAGKWYYMLERGESIVRKVSRSPQETAIFPLGPKKKSLFHMYRLQYRKGDSVIRSLQSIAIGLANSEHPNFEFVRIIQNAQWLEPSNSLLFTGTKENLLRVRELIEEIDVPLRQVFIEMLILETSLDDSLSYGVNWGTRFGGGNWGGAQGFNPVQQGGFQGPGNLGQVPNTSGINPNNLMSNVGFDFGVIGQKIVNTATGIEFSSIGAFVNFLRNKSNTDVVLNPKIITEDNVPAEIFVGENQAFKSQSIANDQGNTITSNFDFRDIGTRLQVTPILGNSDIITLEIREERSEAIPQPDIVLLSQNAPPPNTTKSTTVTRVHIPDGYFLVISGMLNDKKNSAKVAVPCLGGVPILGGAFKQKTWLETKRNQMIFIRPQIIDTEEKIQNLTKHQQDIWRFKRQMKKDWLYEQEEMFDFLNLQPSPTVETNPVLEPFDR